MKKMKKRVYFGIGLAILAISILAMYLLTSPEFRWKRVLEKGKRDFALVLTQEIVEETIDDFLRDKSHWYPELQKINWIARENVLKAYSPWDSIQYGYVAYATFTAWGGRTTIDSYAQFYFDEIQVDTSIARPFLTFRVTMIDIAKQYLSRPENLNSLYILYRPMLVERFRGNVPQIEYAISSLWDYLLFEGKNLSTYEREFFQRREKEGGKQIIREYRMILYDLLNSIEMQNHRQG